MAELFRNSSPGALTMAQAIALEKKRVAERRRQKRQAEDLAAQGRGGDTEIAHLTLGEIVVPEVLQTPEFMAALRRAAADQGISLEKLRVGSAQNRINPNTGAPEFDFSDDFPGTSSAIKNYDFDLPGRDENGLTSEMRNQVAAATNAPVDYSPLQIYPIPEYTNLTEANRATGQGSGAFQSRDGGLRPHHGVDFAVPSGKAIVASGDGVVVSASSLPGYGNQIAIRHDNGITTQVAHVGSIKVKPGDKVTAGQVIGISGDGKNRTAAGNAFGLDPQVHFEVRGGNGLPHKNGGTIYNPFNYLPPLNPHD